ncbi:MAG: sulfatase-like hydrolase/transferase [Eubacteriales bacterium]
MNTTKRPNILIITSDQQRKDSMGCYNDKLQTPGLDSLAKDGVVFDRSYICHPTCTPSRVSILTGQLGSKHGAYTIGTALKEDVPMFSKTLHDEGYETYFIGKPHFQQLSTLGSMEYSGIGKDEEFFRNFEGGYYGFDHTKMYNGHTKYLATASMHYYVWLRDKGLSPEDIEGVFNYVPSDEFREHGAWHIDRELHPSVFTSEETIAFLANHEQEKPFAMWVSFSDPHDPHVAPEPYASMYDPEKVNYLGYVEGEHDNRPDCYNQLYHEGLEALPFHDGIGVPSAPTGKTFGDDAYFKEITAIHHGMVKLMDEEIEKIIAKLKELDMYDNTLIIYSTDHGDYLGNHGYVYKGFPAFEEVYNTPFLVKNINQENAGKRSDALVSHLDIATTVLDAAGVDIANTEGWDTQDGISMMDVFTGKKDKIHDYVLIENRPVQKGFYQKMIVTDEYKLVMYMDSTQGELYNLKEDKDQYDNLWNHVDFKELKLELLKKIYHKYETTKADCNKLTTEEILELMWQQMKAEEPVSVRTSYS